MAQQFSRWEIPPDPEHIGVVRRQVATFASRAGMDSPALTDVQVAVSDAVTNAILHADAARDRGCVRVDAEEAGDELIVRVRDAGSGSEQPPNCPLMGPRLSMIAALAQVFGVRRCEGGATELSMRFGLSRG
jgi:anti-sigma regulatory factor (Ser/Thr protein kinase)